MNHKNIIKVFAAMLLTAPLVFTASCSTDEYAKLNTNPATINKADIKYLFTQEQISYQPFDYLLWYYDANYTSHFAQAYTPAGSFSDLFNQIGALGGAGSRFVEVKKYENEINKTIAEMDAEKAKGYQDIKAMAIKLAEQVGSNDNNVMSAIEDDYVYNKGTGGDGGNNTYGTDNSVSLGASSKNVLDFMKRNHDPRMLVMFTKNSYSSEVIQAFFDAQAKGNTKCAVPKYILDNVNYTTDASGHKRFVDWKGDGEPWVRYYGIPIGLKLSDDKNYTGDNNYFITTRWEVTDGDASKTYRPYSTFNEELVRGRVDFTFPTAPKGKVVQDTEDNPLYEMTLSTAEVNLYLAEFKLLGANLPKSAAAYFKAGVEASAKAYNRLAMLNKIPYYDKEHCNDPFDKPVTYGDKEIENMMANADYQLTGNRASDLEKIYIQLFLHFYYQPLEQFVTVRRSGVPKVGSTLIPWVKLTENTNIPRRFYITEPKDFDKMKPFIIAAAKEQGFTFSDGQNPSLLNTERVWYDKGAPNFGEGPNY